MKLVRYIKYVMVNAKINDRRQDKMAIENAMLTILSYNCLRGCN